jgi:hypothetical protein
MFQRLRFLHRQPFRKRAFPKLALKLALVHRRRLLHTHPISEGLVGLVPEKGDRQLTQLPWGQALVCGEEARPLLCHRSEKAVAPACVEDEGAAGGQQRRRGLVTVAPRRVRRQRGARLRRGP